MLDPKGRHETDAVAQLKARVLGWAITFAKHRTDGCRLDGDLVEDTTGSGVDHGRGVGVDVGVDADDDIDHLA
jgi:hypothetical protein